MWAVKLVGALEKVVQQFRTPFGYMLGVTTYQKERSVFKAVSWSATQVAKAALASPIANGSLEITDLVITTDKANGGTVVLHWEDADANTEIIITTILSDLPIRLNAHFVGKVQGWKGASLYYTVAGANSTGAITVVYVKYGSENSLDYADWNSRR